MCRDVGCVLWGVGHRMWYVVWVLWYVVRGVVFCSVGCCCLGILCIVGFPGMVFGYMLVDVWVNIFCLASLGISCAPGIARDGSLVCIVASLGIIVLVVISVGVVLAMVFFSPGVVSLFHMV